MKTLLSLFFIFTCLFTNTVSHAAKVFIRNGQARFYDPAKSEYTWVPEKEAQDAFDRGLIPVSKETFLREEAEQKESSRNNKIITAVGILVGPPLIIGIGVGAIFVLLITWAFAKRLTKNL